MLLVVMEDLVDFTNCRIIQISQGDVAFNTTIQLNSESDSNYLFKR